jgi:hypothetical protein
MRPSSIATSLASLSLLLATVCMANAASLTRIETGPVYGAATVTVEHGVQVYRPLPPLRHMIVNPDGRTPLNLTIEDRNIVVRHYYYGVASEDTGGSADRFVGGYSLGWGYPGVRHGKRGHRHARRSRPGGYLIRVPSGGRGGR